MVTPRACETDLRDVGLLYIIQHEIKAKWNEQIKSKMKEID